MRGRRDQQASPSSSLMASCATNQAAIARLEQQLGEEVTKRFPGSAVQRVKVLQYGDEPMIEPGELLVRLIVAAAMGRKGQEQALARLGRVDLETLEALITAGIASSRAEAVRWALARIRERSAYAQLRERAREIERLKTEF